MGTIKILGFDEDGNAQRLKIRIARFLDYDPVTASDKSNIRSTLGITSQGGLGDLLAANNLDDVASLDTTKANLEIPDVGTDPSQVPLNQHLGSMAYQSSEGISVATLEVTDKIDLSGAPTQQLEVYGDAPTVRVTDTSDGVGDGDSIGKLEFYGNDGSSGGVGVRTKIDTVSETAAGNQYGVAISTSSANAAPVERVRVDGTGQVGIGTDSPVAQTEISKSSAGDILKISGGSETRGLIFTSSTSAAGSVGAKHTLNAQSTNGEIAFGVAGSEKWRINSSGNLVANGTGIDFGSTNTTTGVTVSTSVLDHYEAGLWTPVVADAVSGGNTATVGTAQGRYTRVGRIVQFSCLVTNIDTTGLTAGLGLYIQGLPFPGVAVSSWKPMTVLMDTITFSGQVVGIIAQNESAIRFKQFASGGADSDLTVSAVAASTADIHVQGVYEVV